MAPPELEELRRQFRDLIDVGYFRTLKALYGAIILFQMKKDEFLWICINYLVFKKITLKNKYPISLIMDLFD